jgi:hypothetical protein
MFTTKKLLASALITAMLVPVAAGAIDHPPSSLATVAGVDTAPNIPLPPTNWPSISGPILSSLISFRQRWCLGGMR